MNEYPAGPDWWEADNLFIVSHEVSHGLAAERQASSDMGSWASEIFDQLGDNDWRLRDLMPKLSAELEFRDDDRMDDFFRLGYLACYRLLSMEANMKGVGLPDLSDEVEQAYTDQIERLVDEDEISGYLDRHMQYFSHLNNDFVDSLFDVIVDEKGVDGEDEFAYFAGIVCMRDVLYQQAKRDEILAECAIRAEESPVRFNSQTLRAIIGTSSFTATYFTEE